MPLAGMFKWWILYGQNCDRHFHTQYKPHTHTHTQLEISSSPPENTKHNSFHFIPVHSFYLSVVKVHGFCHKSKWYNRDSDSNQLNSAQLNSQKHQDIVNFRKEQVILNCMYNVQNTSQPVRRIVLWAKSKQILLSRWLLDKCVAHDRINDAHYNNREREESVESGLKKKERMSERTSERDKKRSLIGFYVVCWACERIVYFFEKAVTWNAFPLFLAHQHKK